MNIGHQFTSKDYGAAPKGYYYPSFGVYFQWLDYSHLKIRGIEPAISSTQTAIYGQIASFDITLHQYCWTSGKWRMHFNLEGGAAYVFDPTFGGGGKELGHPSPTLADIPRVRLVLRL